MGLFQRGVFQKTTFQLASVQTTQEEQASGGWKFYVAYEQHSAKRKKRERELEEEAEQAQQLQDKVDREIAELLHKQQQIDERRDYLERLGQLAKENVDLEAARNYSDRVAIAYQRAVTQGNFSALEALSRELERAADEEEALLQAVLMILEQDD